MKEEKNVTAAGTAGVEHWHKQSPDGPGFHEVISPRQGDTKVISVFRLNLKKDETYVLESGHLELCAMVIQGSLTLDGALFGEVKKYDAFYLPGNSEVALTALEDSVLFIGGAPWEGYGSAAILPFRPKTEEVSGYEVHGEGCCQRNVFFSLPEEVEASRLMCGVVFGSEGGWTGWPPHQHEDTLEEVYCYFDYPDDAHTGMHFCYQTGESIEQAHCFVLKNGSMMAIPKGYHPTVAMPGSKNIYFWILASYRHSGRFFHQAVTDPDFQR